MKDLEQCRREIDEIDQQLIKLFEQRMNVSKDVVTVQISFSFCGLEIFQPEREKAVIEKNAARMMNPKTVFAFDYARNFMQDVMDVGKSYQATFIPLNNLQK
ncbi:MAG: chorismate mutase [Thomasclavelia sp.]